jgi:SAM-dependent methyltransferase
VSVFRGFLELNRRLSLALEGRFPHERFDTNVRYCQEVAEEIRRRPGQVVVDVGGGRALRYGDYLEDGEAHIIAVDISEDELSLNSQVAETRVADVTQTLPFGDGEIDLLTSSSVLEHLPDLGRFLDEAARVLKPDGMMIHILPCRYASFALLNLALPETFKSWLLARLYPETVGICGFRAYYDSCYDPALLLACKSRGLEVERVSFGYAGSSEYYAVFLPIFLISEVIELTTWLLRARQLATTMVIVARRTPQHA